MADVCTLDVTGARDARLYDGSTRAASDATALNVLTVCVWKVRCIVEIRLTAGGVVGSVVLAYFVYKVFFKTTE